MQWESRNPSPNDSAGALDRRTLLKAAAVSGALAGSATAQARAQDEDLPVQETPTGTQRTELAMTPGAGFSQERLERMSEIMRRHVESGRMPGLVCLVSRRGETHVQVIGDMAFDGGAPMRRDTIFRITSTTKPITAAAAMILVEECRLRLDDPVDPWLPELADRQVLRNIDGPIDDTVPAKRPITLRDLLTFRLGHGAVMVFPEEYPIQLATREAGIAAGPTMPSFPPDELMRRYGSLPLLHHPGEGWHYNSGADILGVLIERVVGMTFGEFLRKRIFDPLGMQDTGFHVPEAKLDRLPHCYWTDFATGERAVFDEARGGRFAGPAVFESGAGGLVSTADDYHAFCAMMLNKGVHNGVRILSRPSVELMTMDHLTPQQRSGPHAEPFFGDNSGWGFGMAVATRREDLWMNPGRFGWDGGYGTSAYADPNEELIGILMTQRMMDSPEPPAVFRDFWTSAYQAIGD